MKKVSIKGTIVSNDNKFAYDFFGVESVCPKDVATALAEADGDDVIVEINSGGGEVFAGNEMYYSILNYSGSITIDIVGICGSAASVVAMAAHCRMSPPSLMMIHNVSCQSSGDYRTMEHTADVLKTCNRAIAKAYRVKTKMSEKKLLALMDEEKWLHADEALGFGLVDEIIGEGNDDSVAKRAEVYNANFATILKPDVIAKTRDLLAIKNAQSAPPTPAPASPKDTAYLAEIENLKLQFETI